MIFVEKTILLDNLLFVNRFEIVEIGKRLRINTKKITKLNF